MTQRHSNRTSEKNRPAFYVALLMWSAVVALSLVVAPNWHELQAQPAQVKEVGSGTNRPVAPFASSGNATVPSASSVFSQSSHQVAEHVQAF